MKLHLLSCAVFQREMAAAAADSPHEVRLEMLPQGLHDFPSADMRARVQAAVDAAPADADAVLLGYGLCNNGLSGLRARAVPLVLPRAHDCITLFFGSKERYAEYFFGNPGTYFLTSGWLEQGPADGERRDEGIPHQLGIDLTLQEYIAEYGEDNGRYLYEMLGNHAPHYTRCAYIEMGVEPDDRFERVSRERAAARGWNFVKEAGSLALIRDLLHARWREADFLIVPPGHRVEPTHDDAIVRAVPA